MDCINSVCHNQVPVSRIKSQTCSESCYDSVYYKNYVIKNKDSVRASRRIWAKTTKGRRLEYIKRLSKRAKKYNAFIEKIDPFVVFEKHLWKCFYCEIATPIELIGTRNLSAPTIDHVIPFSKGGLHSYSNVVNACLRCNCTKQDNVQP